MRDVNQETITGTLSWCKSLPLSGFNLIRAKQRLHMRRKELCQTSWNCHPNQKSFTLTIHWNFRTSIPHRSETNGIAERAVRRVKEGTSAVLLQIRIGWKMVVWFCGMLLLSAKCPRSPGRWENSVWKTIWRTIQSANNSFWSNGRISSDFTERFINNSSIWQESITGHLS